MSETKKIANFVESAAILMAASLFARFLGFSYRLPLTAMIGDQGNGIYTISYQIYSFFFLISCAGLPAAISKMISERRVIGRYRDAYRVFTVALSISIMLGTICFIVLLFGAQWISNIVGMPRGFFSLITLAPTVFIVAIGGVLRGYYLGIGKVAISAVSQVVDQVFNAVFSLYCCYLLMNSTIFGTDKIALGAAGGTLGTGIGALAGVVFLIFMFLKTRPTLLDELYRDNHTNYELKGKLAKTIMSITFPIVIGTAVFSITNIIDSSMAMSRLTKGAGFSIEEATSLIGQLGGKFNVLTTLPISISTQLSVAVIPSIAASTMLGDIAIVKKKINTVLRLGMIIAFPAATGLSVLSYQLLSLLFPLNSDGSMLIRIGAIMIIFMSLVQIATGVLQSIGKERIPIYGALLGVMLKIPLNYVLIGIKNINIIGAVISTTALCLVASVFNLVCLAKTMNIKLDLNGIILKPALSSLLMGLVTYTTYHLTYMVCPINSISILISILLSFILYFICLLVIGGIYQDDLQQIPYGKKLMQILSRYSR